MRLRFQTTKNKMHSLCEPTSDYFFIAKQMLPFDMIFWGKSRILYHMRIKNWGKIHMEKVHEEQHGLIFLKVVTFYFMIVTTANKPFHLPHISVNKCTLRVNELIHCLKFRKHLPCHASLSKGGCSTLMVTSFGTPLYLHVSTLNTPFQLNRATYWLVAGIQHRKLILSVLMGSYLLSFQ